MPYGKRYDRKLRAWVVYLKKTKRILAKHPNEEAANRHLAALYANVKKG